MKTYVQKKNTFYSSNRKISILFGSLTLFSCLFLILISCTKKAENIQTEELSQLKAASIIYYIDAINGLDSNSGTRTSTAWKTFTKVNSKTFLPGQQILLKCGGIWTSQLYPKGSGTLTNPITISSYGTGNKPIINGGGIAGAAVYLFNQSNWIIQNLEVTNSAIRDNVFREGIYVQNQGGGTLSNIQILNNYVHNVSGTFLYGSSDPHAWGGIVCNIPGTAGTDRFDNVLIQGNTVEASGRTGIVVWDNVWSGAGFSSTNVKIRQNTVKDIDSDGILTFGCDGAIVEYNVANNCGRYAETGAFNGTCAIWSTRGANCVVQYNEAYNTQKLLDNADGQGFDHDYDAVGNIIQYNYSHDNGGGFVLLISGGTTSSNCVVRYNISQNDRTRVFNFAGGIIPNTQIYNNTIYINSTLSTNIIDHSWDLNMAPTYYFANNIVYNLGSGIYNIPGTLGANAIFNYNLYYGNHPASEPGETFKLTSDPKFVNPGSCSLGIGSLTGYWLKVGSPALLSGMVVPTNGGKDPWDNAVSATTPPNRGAFNGPGQ